MATGLNVNRVVSVAISLSAVAAGYRNFGSMLCMGSTPGVIDTVERKRDYDDIDGVGADFSTTAPEYLFAEQFFSQSPQPTALSIGRWAQTSTHGHLRGAELVPVQRVITAFNTISNGSLRVFVDGVPYTLTGLNFAVPLQTNLNGVAQVIQAALQAAGAVGATVIWNGVYYRFEVASGTTGTTSSLSYATVATAATAVAFSAQPAASSVLTLNGTGLTFVTANPQGNQVLIGASLVATLANAATAINASTDAQISLFTAVAKGSTLYLYADTAGTGGNSLTVAAGGTSNGVVSASPMTGGGGTDVSVLTGLSATPTGAGLAVASPPVAGIAAETALSAVATLGDLFGDWYCLGFAPVTALADSDALQVAGYIQAAGQSRIVGFTTQNTAATDPTQATDLASLLMAGGYGRSFVEYSSTNPYAVASLFGRFATVNYDGSATTITGKFKQQPGVVAETITATQANALLAKNCNVYANYQNATAITQEAVMADGTFIDSRINADWLANRVQTDVYNLLYTSSTKIPQTNAGMAQIGNTCVSGLSQGVANGYLAPGQWNATGFGTLKYQDYLTLGYYVYIPDISTQSESNRQKRLAVPIQIAAKEAGAVHHSDIAITINP